ncbi:MAG TPA: hypothetical protein VIJ75_23385 [Hanamia sp.]
MNRIVLLLSGGIVMLSIFACNKNTDNPQRPVTDTTVITPVIPEGIDSVRLLTSINGTFSSGDAFVFNYDSLNRITSFYRPYLYSSNDPCYIIYDQERINYILCVYDDNMVYLSSMIFKYGPNKKCAKIYYKAPVLQVSNPDPSYFVNINDGKVRSVDSLVYNSNNFISEIYIDLINIIKFNYASPGDSIPFNIEEYHFDDNNNKFLYDQLTVSCDSTDNPFYLQNMWYMAFANKLSVLTGGGGNVMVPPIITDNPSTYLKGYVSLLPKLLTNYKVYNTWGSYNYSSGFSYSYNFDSSILKSTSQKSQNIYANYFFSKRQKK